MTNFATIINDLFSSTDKNGYINSLVNCDLLIIDDLGANVIRIMLLKMYSMLSIEDTEQANQ